MEKRGGWKTSRMTPLPKRGLDRFPQSFLFLVFFLEFLVFLPCEAFLVFLSVVPFFSRDFRGSIGIKNPCFFGGFSLPFPKKQGKEGQGPCTVCFPFLSGVSALFFLYENPQQSRPEALLEGSKHFRESAFSGTFSSPHSFAPPHITARVSYPQKKSSNPCFLFVKKKSKKDPEKSKAFSFRGTLKSLGKEGKTHKKKTRKIGRRKKARKSTKKQGLEGQGTQRTLPY